MPEVPRPAVTARRAGLWAVVAVLVAGAACGDGRQKEAPVPPLGESEARTAIVSELLAQPEARSGTVRFAIRAPDLDVEGVADYDRQRFVSRAELDRADVSASYDVAVIDGVKYEKLLEIRNVGQTPDFTPTWSSAESWAPEKEAIPSVPYPRLPLVGEPGFDIRRDVDGFDDARRRQVVESIISSFSRVGDEVRHDEPTVQYRLTLDRARVEEVLGDELTRGLVQIAPAAPGTIDLDVWIDHRGRLRAVHLGASQVTYEWWDYGQPGAVSIPGDLKLRE